MHASDFFPEARMQKALTSAMLHGEIGSRCYSADNRRMFFLFFSFGISINIEFEKKFTVLHSTVQEDKLQEHE